MFKKLFISLIVLTSIAQITYTNRNGAGETTVNKKYNKIYMYVKGACKLLLGCAAFAQFSNITTLNYRMDATKASRQQISNPLEQQVMDTLANQSILCF